MANCKYCGIELMKGKGAGSHVVWCIKNPNVEQTRKSVSVKSMNRKHTENTKKKISDSRKKYLDEYPDQVPYRLYHSSKKSWPEITFEKYFGLALASLKVN